MYKFILSIFPIKSLFNYNDINSLNKNAQKGRKSDDPLCNIHNAYPTKKIFIDMFS